MKKLISILLIVVMIGLPLNTAYGRGGGGAKRGGGDKRSAAKDRKAKARKAKRGAKDKVRQAKRDWCEDKVTCKYRR